jgi:hypothetical protein
MAAQGDFGLVLMEPMPNGQVSPAAGAPTSRSKRRRRNNHEQDHRNRVGMPGGTRYLLKRMA